jgi:hypothetical protein
VRTEPSGSGHTLTDADFQTTESRILGFGGPPRVTDADRRGPRGRQNSGTVPSVSSGAASASADSSATTPAAQPDGLTQPENAVLATPKYAELCPSRTDPLANAPLTAAQSRIKPLQTGACTLRHSSHLGRSPAQATDCGAPGIALTSRLFNIGRVFAPYEHASIATPSRAELCPLRTDPFDNAPACEDGLVQRAVRRATFPAPDLVIFPPSADLAQPTSQARSPYTRYRPHSLAQYQQLCHEKVAHRWPTPHSVDKLLASNV